MARGAKKASPKSAYEKAKDAAFSEVYGDVPESVERSGKTGKARTAMMRAIALSKIRQSKQGVSR